MIEWASDMRQAWSCRELQRREYGKLFVCYSCLNGLEVHVMFHRVKEVDL